jgi:uncharacterized protein (DUF2252 family)
MIRASAPIMALRILSGRAERVASGRELRRSIPRSSHAAWPSPFPERPDPVDMLELSHTPRLAQLAPVRWGRMVGSPFAFLRGSAMVMAWDLAHLPHSEIYVQACGDAHLCNFGVSATPERRLIFDVRDFDETLPAPWEWDVKRLAASIVVAARQRGMHAGATRDAVLGAMAGYRRAMRDALALTYKEIWYRRVDAEALEAGATGATRRYFRRMFRKARRRTSKREVGRLVETTNGQSHIRRAPPLIFPVTDVRVRDNLCSLLDEYVHSLSPDRRVLLDRYHVIDVAYRVVGVGSVGTRCQVALLYGDGEDDPLILQLKEAGRSVLEPFVRPCPYANQGERVVQGQRILQAASDLFLGWKRRGHHDFYVRQLKDMKGTVDIDEMDPQTIVDFAALCGMTLAHAHARSGDFCQIAGYLGKGERFDTAIADFAEAYADQVERDHALLERAVRGGRLPADRAAA